MFTKRVSPMAVTHPPAVLAHQAPRLLDKLWMNPAGQQLIDPRNKITPEQERLIRAIIAAQGANRGGIPTRPQ